MADISPLIAPPPAATIDEIRKVVALSDLPDEHLQWILDRAEPQEYQDGAILAKTGGIPEHMYILLDGKVDFYMNVNGNLVYFHTFENDKTTGGMTGLLPYSRMKVYVGDAIAAGKVRVLALHKKYFEELERLNPALIQRLIGYMTERARTFATIQLQHEKVSALGKLAAGIAHELNNPAAAINRIAEDLKTRLVLNYQLTSALLVKDVGPEQIEQVRTIAREKETLTKKRSAIECMMAEDEIMDWFRDHKLPESREIAETLAEFGFSPQDFDTIRQDAPDDSAFADLLRWLQNILLSDRLLTDLREASTRISHLVGAIKRHVHMDQSNDVQRTNIHSDIENTLSLMSYKLKQKNITVEKRFSEDLPQVDAFIGELNQVWTNLIDNAIDAVEKDGLITIETTRDHRTAFIRVIDNGSGIPENIQSRIFDPFFTTKKVGQGTGIGLDTVKRIVGHHHGEIKVESTPGRTQFTVCMPITHTPPERKDNRVHPVDAE
jgi:signal transduction histidine kinase